MITTGLMTGLGIFILWQTIFVKWPILSLIFSIDILFLGLLVIRMIYEYFKHCV